MHPTAYRSSYRGACRLARKLMATIPTPRKSTSWHLKRRPRGVEAPTKPAKGLYDRQLARSPRKTIRVRYRSEAAAFRGRRRPWCRPGFAISQGSGDRGRVAEAKRLFDQADIHEHHRCRRDRPRPLGACARSFRASVTSRRRSKLALRKAAKPLRSHRARNALDRRHERLAHRRYRYGGDPSRQARQSRKGP